jgi:protein-disulfide isomerase
VPLRHLLLTTLLALTSLTATTPAAGSEGTSAPRVINGCLTSAPDPGTPEITWNDLNRSLAPEGVVRTEWALVLAAAALPTQALPPAVYQALAQGAATDFWPDGPLPVPGTPNVEEFFERNGPRYHVSQGRLYVIASPTSETFVGMASRTPGAVLLQDTVAHLPVVD